MKRPGIKRSEIGPEEIGRGEDEFEEEGRDLESSNEEDLENCIIRGGEEDENNLE